MKARSISPVRHGLACIRGLRSGLLHFVRSGLTATHIVSAGRFVPGLTPPNSTDSQTPYEPAMMWSHVGFVLFVTQSNLSSSYGKMNDFWSLRHGQFGWHVVRPQLPEYGPSCPVCDVRMAPFWLSRYTRWPTFASIRANIPSPPIRCCQLQSVAGGGAHPMEAAFAHAKLDEPLSCAPPTIVGGGEAGVPK